MIERTIYLLLFAMTNLALYSKLNKTGWISNRTFYLFTALFIIFAVLHLEIFHIPYLLDWRGFSLALELFIPPIIFCFFFRFIIFKRVSKLEISDKTVKSVGLDMFEIFFTMVPYAFALLIQFGIAFGAPLNR